MIPQTLSSVSAWRKQKHLSDISAHVHRNTVYKNNASAQRQSGGQSYGICSTDRNKSGERQIADGFTYTQNIKKHRATQQQSNNKV